ncbi:MAG: hypothetical protein LBC02_12915 [Planctomycetaceae bacterium]|nr:hypothetical protein [Planctomycetaceae bacterium]
MTKIQKNPNRYEKLIEKVFFNHYQKGAKEVSFSRQEFIDTAANLAIELPRNIGDIIYSFRYRTSFPASIVELAPVGTEWVIRLAGKGKYKFSLSSNSRIIPNHFLAETKILDATPGVIDRYALDDEQALLAQLRYNRLIDIFTGTTCYSLQSHLRTTVIDVGQVETDEIYIGVDKRGIHYVLPVQAKRGNDQLGIVQMEQDFSLCEEKFPSLICIPIAAQFMEQNLIALFSFEQNDNGISMVSEKHYRLVDSVDLSDHEIQQYKIRPENNY